MEAKTPIILPLFCFFERLRQNDFPLGMGDYRKLLVALDQLYGLQLSNYTNVLQLLGNANVLADSSSIIPKTELLRLCKLLWLKPDQSIELFEEIFACSFQLDMEMAGIAPQIIDNTIPENEAPPGEEISKPIRKIDEQGNDLQENNQAFIPEMEYEINEKKIAIRVGLGKEQFENSIEFTNRQHIPEQKTKFLFTQNYFPIDTRKVHQTLRLLPSFRQFNASHEIDVQATIDKIVQTGFFFHAVRKQNKINSTRLLVLIDNGPSMIAFDQLGNTIHCALKQVFASKQCARQKELQVFYYYDAGMDFFFTNKSHTQSQPARRILDQLKNKSAAVLIISDGGAAKRYQDAIRLANSLQLLTKLKTTVGRVAWLNPMPKNRWEKTPAEKIARMTAMFEATETGIKNAVDYLKGKSINKQAL